MNNKDYEEGLYGEIGTYAELRKALSASTLYEYTREEIVLTPNNVVLLIHGFEGEVNNGGIDQFFFNSSGDYLQETIDALKIIGAKKAAIILKDACARFPGSGPPTNLKERRELLLRSVSPDSDAFNDLDDLFYRYEDDLYELLKRYEEACSGRMDNKDCC